jgi:uncharacterized protein (TIGR01777 family)
MNIIVSGGRGFIGSHLIPGLREAGHTVSMWSRTSDGASGVKTYVWDPVSGPPPAESLEGIDAVINMAGEPVAHRWSDDLKKKIRESRVAGTRHIVEGMERATVKPKVLVSSSATGYYGDRGEEELTEQSVPGSSFLSGVCQEWEAAADEATKLGVRVVKLRTGMVIGSGGGALARLVSAFKTKMGGKLGSGSQWMPWIHMSDLTGIYRYAAEHDVSGVLNGAAPHAVRNEEFTEALAQALGEPGKLSIPEFALKMMFGEMSEVMLASQHVIPEATLASGYQFQFSEIGAAVRNALGVSQ